MTTSYNDITGKPQKTKGSNDAYRSGWDAIFAKKTVYEMIEVLPQERQDVVNAFVDQKVADTEVYHLRSYGDVTKEQLDAYLATGTLAADKPTDEGGDIR